MDIIDEIAAGVIISRIREDLEKAADEILELSKQLATKNQELNALKDDQALKEARIRAAVSTATNKETGRPRFPNVDAQNARVVVELSESDDYVGHKIILLDTQGEVEVLKAQLVRLHEKRKDARTEADLISALLS